MNIAFRKPTINDAELLLGWRSQARVNSMMFTDVYSCDIEKQKKWLGLSAQREDYEHFIILGDQQPVGFLSYSEIDRVKGCCSCGSYFGSVESARKYGGYMHTYFMDYIFYVLNLRKYVVNIIDANPRVLKLQRLLGLRDVGVLKEHILKNNIYRDVYIFELLKKDWESHRWDTHSIEESLKAFGIKEKKL
jgi:RimJ/RimL family protein N-acetyltransferase